MGTSARNSSWEGSIMKTILIPLAFLGTFLQSEGSPVADPLVLGSAVHASGNPVSSNCKEESVELITHSCSPTAESFCIPNTLDTEEIEFEKVCVDVVNTICDDPTIATPAFTAFKHKRAADAEAEAVADAGAEAVPEADPLLIASHIINPAAPKISAVLSHVGHAGHLAVPPAPAPVPALVGAVPHPAVATITHPCHQVSTEHCFDSPKVKQVPVDVENCHTVTKVSCTEVKKRLPKTVCTPVTTTEVSYPRPVQPLVVPNLG